MRKLVAVLVLLAACAASSGWILRERDNICGIHSARRISNPAVVDYDGLLRATPEMREVEREGIDPDSPRGKALREGARVAVTRACEEERSASGYCGVWKAIEHEDGRTIPDITEQVEGRL